MLKEFTIDTDSADLEPFISNKQARIAINTLQTYVERCNDVEDHIFSLLFKLEKIIDKNSVNSFNKKLIYNRCFVIVCTVCFTYTLFALYVVYFNKFIGISKLKLNFYLFWHNSKNVLKNSASLSRNFSKEILYISNNLLSRKLTNSKFLAFPLKFELSRFHCISWTSMS